jgi:hypothetical protein
VPDWTRIVILGDVFRREGRSASPKIVTRVTRWTENKALVSTGANPKVTGRIGPASANIMLDCVIK